MSKTISIIGCGWLGLPLAQHLRQKGAIVKGSTTSEHKLQFLKQFGIEPFLIKLTPEITSTTRDFFESDILIVDIPPRNQNGQSEFHLRQLQSLHQAASEGTVSRVVFVSSTGVYPNLNRVVTEEDASAESLSRGGVRLLEAEQVFKGSSDFQTTILRFGGLYGPGRHPGRFLSGKRNLSGATNPVNMIHLEDCIGAIEVIIDAAIWGETFSVCSPDHPSRKDFYEKAASELGIPPPTFSQEATDFKEVNVEKFLSFSNYQFKH